MLRRESVERLRSDREQLFRRQQGFELAIFLGADDDPERIGRDAHPLADGDVLPLEPAEAIEF